MLSELSCCLIFLTYLHILSAKSVLDNGVCRRNGSTVVEIYCCDNYEPRSDDESKCQECQPGFTSKNGRECKKCKENSFGEKCSSNCNCPGGEICHNVNGCVAKTQTQSAVMSAGFDTSTNTMVLYPHTSAGVRLTGENVGVLTRDKMLIYIMSTGLCAVAIGLFVIFRKRGTQFFYMLKMRRKTSVNSKLRIQVMNAEIPQLSDSIYDLIDDQNMLDNQERNGNN